MGALPMLDFTIDYTFVDAIPFGAHVARRDEDGHVSIYLSRGATEDQLSEGLSLVHGAAALEYVCRERHAIAG